MWTGEDGAAAPSTRLKLVVNSWVIAVSNAAGEIVTLAKAIGVPPAQFFEVLDGGGLDLPFLRIKADLVERGALSPANFAVDTARKAAEIIQAHLRRAFQIDGLDLMLRTSIGAAWFPRHGRNFEMLLAKADVAMSVARQQGGNRLLVYDDAYGEQLRGDFELQSALATVLDRNELVLHYQPIIDTRYNRVVGVEALMRWMRGSQMLSPGKFIPLAEDSGLDFRMGEWAISEALQQLRRWQLAGVPIPGVSVNVSVRHLRQPTLLRAAQQALEATEMPASALTLELTEIDVMRDIENVLPTLWELKKAGIRIALDDFGSGFSSVSYLTRMPVDTLKIDRVFVSELENDIGRSRSCAASSRWPVRWTCRSSARASSAPRR